MAVHSRDQENHIWKPAQANSSRDHISKYPTQNRDEGVTQVVECLPSDCEALSSNSKYHLSPPTPKKHYMVLSLLLMQKTVEYVFFQLWHRIFNYLDSLYIIFI
jgi:hypothetical protein